MAKLLYNIVIKSTKLVFVSKNNQVQAYLNIWQNIFTLVLPASYMDELFWKLSSL
jgi:hypothetical protein